MLVELMELKESLLLSNYHDIVENEIHQSWQDLHIKSKHFREGHQVLLYDNKFLKHLGKLQMNWLGLFIILEVKYRGFFKLTQLDGILK